MCTLDPEENMGAGDRRLLCRGGCSRNGGLGWQGPPALLCQGTPFAFAGVPTRIRRGEVMGELQ